MTNIDNTAAMRGVSSAGNGFTIGGMSPGSLTASRRNYDSYLLNSLNGLATINLPYFKLNSFDRIFNCDGVIRDFKQGLLKNDKLLGELKSLSYTSEGARLIKHSIKKNLDNSITVNFNGIGKKYRISPQEFNDAAQKFEITDNVKPDGTVIKTKEKVYSKGDANIIVFELAMEKLLEDILSGNLNKNVSDYNPTKDDNVENITNDNLCSQVYYLLSGKKPVSIQIRESNSPDSVVQSGQNSKAMIKDFIDVYKQNPNRYAVSFKLNENCRFKDNTKRNIAPSADSTYSLKTINYEKAIFTSSSDSSKLLYMPLDDLAENICALNYLDTIEQNQTEQE